MTTLTAPQQQALYFLSRGWNVYLCGPPGSGKSFIFDYYRRISSRELKRYYTWRYPCPEQAYKSWAQKVVERWDPPPPEISRYEYWRVVHFD